MKKQLRFTVLLALGLTVAVTQGVQARVISTFDPGGADTEVREAAPTTPRGTNDGSGTEEYELGMRINGPSHNGHVYLKFGVAGVNAANLAHPITVRTHWSLNNLGNNRIEDAVDLVNATFNDNPNVAFDYFVLDPTNPKANWNEATMVYGPGPNGAPGIQFDGNFTTKDLLIGPGNLTPLGTNELRSLTRNGVGPGSAPIENRIPIGEAFDITFPVGSPLHAAIVAAQATGHKTVTIVTDPHFDSTTTNSAWLNFNYVWMPKEKADVSSGSPPNYGAKDGWDNDTTDMIDWDPVASGINPPNSPFQGQLNTQANPFAPSLVFAEPTSLVLMGLCGMSLLSRRRVG